MRAVKTVTGQNLDWFFDQWIFKPGHPVFDIRSEWNEAEKTIKLKVTQVQDFSRGVPVFKMPASVKIVTPKGQDTKTVWIREKEETFEFSAEQKPYLVRFDEGNNLLMEYTFPKDLDELIYQLKNDDVRGRMWAASELVKFKDDPKVFQSLSACALKDPFWAVRRSAIETLGKIQARDVPAVLKKACLDARSTVRAAALAALGDRKDRSFIEFYKERFRKDTSYLVQAEALRALGKTGDPAVVPFLENAASLPSHNNVFKTAAESARKDVKK
jgi:aminopeptidase N